MVTGPYHKWLGIPPEEQPPNHYRLLGVPQFESDADVIETAAEQRTLLLRTFQTGPEAELAERLLNEVAAARVCLLRPASKAEYDDSLRDAVTEAEPPPAVFPAEYELPKPTVTPERHYRNSTRPNSLLLSIVVGGLLLTPLVVVMWWFIGRGGSDEMVQSKTPPEQQTPDATTAEKTAADKAAIEKVAAEQTAKQLQQQIDALKDKLAAEKKAAIEKAAAEKTAKQLQQQIDALKDKLAAEIKAAEIKAAEIKAAEIKAAEKNPETVNLTGNWRNKRTGTLFHVRDNGARIEVSLVASEELSFFNGIFHREGVSLTSTVWQCKFKSFATNRLFMGNCTAVIKEPNQLTLKIPYYDTDKNGNVVRQTTKTAIWVRQQVNR